MVKWVKCFVSQIFKTREFGEQSRQRRNRDRFNQCLHRESGLRNTPITSLSPPLLCDNSPVTAFVVGAWYASRRRTNAVRPAPARRLEDRPQDHAAEGDERHEEAQHGAHDDGRDLAVPDVPSPLTLSNRKTFMTPEAPYMSAARTCRTHNRMFIVCLLPVSAPVRAGQSFPARSRF